MSLRVRLALVAAAAVAAAVVVASVIVYFLVRNELSGQLDRNLQAQAGRISGIGFVRFQPTSEPKVFILLTPVPSFRFGDNYFQLVDDKGDLFKPRFASVSLPVTRRAQDVAAGLERQYYSEARVGGEHLRIFTLPLPRGPAPPGQTTPRLAVQVVSSLSGLDSELGKIKLWLALVALGGIAIASAVGFVVARAALRPLRRLSETAEHVRATRDLTRRIDVSGNDELSRLATTFNSMLASLDEAAKRQRQLVQDASHELRTPLTSLRTNIEVLASDPVMTDEEREQLLTDVVEQLAEMTALVGEVTELARGEEQQLARQDVRLDLLAKEAIRRTTRNHPDVPILSDLSPTVVVGVPATLERAIANLLDNAAKWTPPGSHVWVALHEGELLVRDRGPGIADADLPHVFERFYRATSARSMPGSGLGLAIVKQVADQHGGTVSAERAPDGGTTMRLRIPTADRSQGAAALVGRDLASS